MSLPCRFSVDGSWIWKKNASTSRYEVSDGSKTISTKTTYRDILAFFFQIHDPSTLNRQGNDIGTSYRSALFPLTPEQEQVARATIADVDASGKWPGKVVTTIEAPGPFWEAEPEHQVYLIRYPNGYTCHFARPGWVLPKRDAQAA